MIIAIANQKGGQGKTTTAQALATKATSDGKKSLAIDLDPQGNLTFSMGLNGTDAGAYELLTGQLKPEQLIHHTPQGDIIPSGINLATADTNLTGENRHKALADALKQIKKEYDLITIDCPPTLNILLVNALTAADKVIIPLTSDMYALQGLYQLKQSIQAAQKINSKLTIGGVVFTRHSTRTILSRDLTDVIINKCTELDIPVYKTVIHEGIAIREAQTHRESIFDYAPKSKPTQDYIQLIKEIGL